MEGCYLMKDVRIVIVDDSAFSVAFIREILENNGFQVVGQAGSLEEVKEVVKNKKPTLVTMDLTLPGTDGFECMEAVHEIDKNIKGIFISSMMDEEIIKTARKSKASAYLQKPVDADDLITTIKRVMEYEELYLFLKDKYFAVFKEALMDTVNKMTKTLLKYKDSYSSDREFESVGVTTIIGIIGEFSGRMLIDLSKETAKNLTKAILRRNPRNNDELTAALREFTNIVAGNACSILNRKNKALGLRVAPPSILSGENVLISAPDFNTTAVKAETNFGEVLLNVGFKEGEEKWM
jgi:CheY-specific phosphatase CheX/CheY-like chemotaxis protein